MKNTFGNNLTVTLFGESHGEAIGAVIDGITPGIAVNNEFIEIIGYTGDKETVIIPIYLNGFVVKYIANKFKGETGVDVSKDPQALQRLTEAAEKAKAEKKASKGKKDAE